MKKNKGLREEKEKRAGKGKPSGTRLSVLLGCLLLLLSCTPSGDEPTPVADPLIKVRFTLRSPAPENGASTRSTSPGTVNENGIASLWLLQFQDGTFKRKEFLESPDTTGFYVPLYPGVSNLYFVANVGEESLSGFDEGETSFLSSRMEVPDEGSLLYTSAQGVHYLPMWGELSGFEIKTSGETLEDTLTLMRSVVRLKLNYSVDASLASIYTLQSIRLLNIPVWMAYIPPASGNYPAELSPGEVFSTSPEAADNGGGSLLFYLPENRRGQGGNTTLQPKGKTGVDYATCVELSGTVTGGEYAGYRAVFRIYPGGNDYNDYNLVRNNSYSLDYNLRGLYQSDARLSILPPEP
ncbi:MAG: DUF4906 domain-containing protein [Bacteroides sp.]|jgi:hypothetical protein|nr:DUF4906 domain-containing protein [Bacteroides sp.]